jgi:hypothetical protein
MIEFTAWRLQLLRYCDFILAADAVWNAWVDNNYSKTSITDFDELYEQLFDDLDSESILENLSSLIQDKLSEGAITEFLLAIKTFDIEARPIIDRKDNRNLLMSMQWNIVRDAAKNVAIILRSE